MQVTVELSEKQLAAIKAGGASPEEFVLGAVDAILSGEAVRLPREQVIYQQRLLAAVTKQRNDALDVVAQAQAVIDMMTPPDGPAQAAGAAEQPAAPPPEPPAATPENGDGSADTVKSGTTSVGTNEGRVLFGSRRAHAKG
jgi:hypothetical protein